MEEKREPPTQSSDESNEDTATVDDEKEPSTSQFHRLSESVHALALQSQPPMSLSIPDVERSLSKHKVLDGNLQDLLDLEQRIAKIIQLSTDHVLDERFPWPVKSALLQAMINTSTQRQLGAALMQYVDELRLRTDLTDGSEKRQLQLDVMLLRRKLINILVLEKSREASDRKQEYVQEINEGHKDVFKRITMTNRLIEFEKKRLKWKFQGKLEAGRTFEELGLELFFTHFIQDKEEYTKTTMEELYSLASNLCDNLRTLGFWTNDNKARYKTYTNNVIDTAKSARGLQSNCKEEEEKSKIEKAIREVILQSLNLLDVCYILKKVQRDKNWTFPRGIWKKGVKDRPPGSTSCGQETTTKSLPRSLSVPVSGKAHAPAVGAVAGGASVGPITGAIGSLVGGFSGIFGGPLGAAAAGVASGVVAASQRNPFASQKVETPIGPSVMLHSGMESVTCVATPYSDPVYLKGGGGSSGGGGGGGDDSDDGGDGGGGGGGDGGGEGDRDPHPEYRRRYLDAYRSLTDAINDLCRITSQINGIQNDCREMIVKLETYDTIMLYGLPTSALSYEECLEELLKLREPIALLNDDRPMVRIEFFRTLRYVVSAVCKTLDVAAQCQYLLSLMDCDLAAAKVGVVDVKQLKKAVDAAQFSCYKMMQFSPEQAREEGVQLRQKMNDLLAVLTEASKRTLNMKERIESAATNVQRSAEELYTTLDLNNRESILAAIMKLLSSVKRVGVLTEDPDVVPIAASLSREARERRDDVFNSARNLNENTKIQVHSAAHENLGDDSRPLTWFSGRDVTREFEELVVAVRKNGFSAGFIEHQQSLRGSLFHGRPLTSDPN